MLPIDVLAIVSGLAMLCISVVRILACLAMAVFCSPLARRWRTKDKAGQGGGGIVRLGGFGEQWHDEDLRKGRRRMVGSW